MRRTLCPRTYGNIAQQRTEKLSEAVVRQPKIFLHIAGCPLDSRAGATIANSADIFLEASDVFRKGGVIHLYHVRFDLRGCVPDLFISRQAEISTFVVSGGGGLLS